jgi:uncharacterized membrane protein
VVCRNSTNMLQMGSDRGDTRMRWLWLVICALVIGLFIADAWHAYSQLPQQVATHFDAEGEPDAWDDRQQFLTGILVGWVVVTGMALTLPFLVRVLPIGLINVPNAAYWRAPERADATRDKLFRRVGWLSCASVILGAAMFDAILRANLQPQPRLGGWPIYVGLYFAFVVAWLAEVIWQFGLATKE